jgi:hypothetical protein
VLPQSLGNISSVPKVDGAVPSETWASVYKITRRHRGEHRTVGPTYICAYA